MSEFTESSDMTEKADEAKEAPKLSRIGRRILGVLIEKARTTPDGYPLSLNGLVTGANQKSNRSPLMSLTPEQVEDELVALREIGAVAEVHGGGRVPKYRHYASDFLGVKGIETGIMAELLLRGEQTIGDLRSRASRFGAIADVGELQTILASLIERGLVVALTPAGRGQIVTHTLYQPEELERVKRDVATNPQAVSAPTSSSRSTAAQEVEKLRAEVAALTATVEELKQRVTKLEG